MYDAELYGPGMPSTKVTGFSSVEADLDWTRGAATLLRSTDWVLLMISGRTPGSENKGTALMPVKTPDRFGVGMPVRLKLLVVMARGLAICRRPVEVPLTTGEES